MGQASSIPPFSSNRGKGTLFPAQGGTDYWQRCVRAVALAAQESPGYLESTYQLARNDVAYDMK
jgi:hypothetical protein